MAARVSKVPALHRSGNGRDVRPALCDFDTVRSKLLERAEIALLDVREEALHAEGHPLFAANFPYSHIELNAYSKLPRRDVPIVTIDSGEGLAEAAARRLIDLGYVDVAVFTGGIDAWKAAGGELFIDVNVPSKAFGELMEATCHTPSLPAHRVKELIDAHEDMIIVDVRRFDEYQTMCIPSAVSVPGAEVVLRVPDLAPRPETRIIVNCAGRTRGLLGTQSLINAGVPNSVAALRNGTIGWTLAGQQLEFGQARRFPDTPRSSIAKAAQRARRVAERAGVQRASLDDVSVWSEQHGRTTYFFDVRSHAEYEAGHLPQFRPVPGGQLVQEVEMYAPVRGARIVLVDDDGARANMCASWLAQMAWDVYVAEGLPDHTLSATGPWQPRLPPVPDNPLVTAAVLDQWLRRGKDLVVIDASPFAVYRKGHIPGAWYALRSQLRAALAIMPSTPRYVVTCPNGVLARFIAPEVARLTGAEACVLDEGNAAWTRAGFALEARGSPLASPPIDRYNRPYEGTDVTAEAMQAYLDWEFGLIEQLRRDGTHYFQVLKPDSLSE